MPPARASAQLLFEATAGEMDSTLAASGQVRPMLFLNDHRLLNPHAGWAPYTENGIRLKMRSLVSINTRTIPPMVVNNEVGDKADRLTAIARLRRAYPDVRLGVFVNATMIRYWSLASADPERYAKAKASFLEAHMKGRDAYGVEVPGGLQGLSDFAVIYGYRLTPDRAVHRRGVERQLELAREHFNKPIYLFVTPMLAVTWKQWGFDEPRLIPPDEWAWEAREVWPLFDGVIIFNVPDAERNPALAESWPALAEAVLPIVKANQERRLPRPSAETAETAAPGEGAVTDPADEETPAERPSEAPSPREGE